MRSVPCPGIIDCYLSMLPLAKINTVDSIPTRSTHYLLKGVWVRWLQSRGDPDKCDNFGNTSLHCAAAKGHVPCVTFLVNFGANIYALDNQYHSPKDLAAIGNRQEVLRFLDSASAKQQSKDPNVSHKVNLKTQM
ncbi:hypothetical protein HAZT_HAZT002173 [Hyalella azteca]|uniref:Uncharacterized protein n=1 Tax=Hyalella azteca TaxID=294128 RepID=A0A6A0H6V3_HYAAZ|nr:hypothetical protein HAZT_HAZT002173 [Hyalella azteca]